MTNFDDTKKVIDQIVEEFDGRLDIFVANAGIPWTQGRMIDGDLSHYHKVVSTDLDGVFYCAKAAGEVWRRQSETGVATTGEKLSNYSYGSFIATASMSGHIANIPQLQSAVSNAKSTWHNIADQIWTVQRRKSWRNSSRQVSCCRMGQVCPSQYGFSGVYRNRDIQLCAGRNKDHLAWQDTDGSGGSASRVERSIFVFGF